MGKTQYITEQMYNCGCHKEAQISYFLGKKGISQPSYSGRMTCSKCNSPLFPRSKRHYVKLPKPLDDKELTEWMKKNKKIFLGKEGLAALKRPKHTFTTKEQREHERKKKLPPVLVKTYKLDHNTILYYGEVLVFKTLESPTEENKIVVAHRGKQLVMKTSKLQSILGFKKGVDPKVYFEAEIKSPTNSLTEHYFK